MLVLLLAYLPASWIVQIATGLNIENRQVECSASLGARSLVLVAVKCLALLIQMAIGYWYFRSNGEGPYGPLRRRGSREEPNRRRLLPCVSNGMLVGMMIFFVMFLVISRC
jgi:hypothetical protein